MSSADPMAAASSHGRSEQYVLEPWAYKVPGFHIYDGVVMGDSSPREYLDDVRNMELYGDDVFVVSYPKSGE